MTDTHITLGVIVGTHGVHGRVRVKTYTDSPKNLEQYGKLSMPDGGEVELKVTSVKSDSLVIAEIKGITRKEQGEQLVGTELSIQRDQLPESQPDEIYVADLIGLEVKDATSGKPAGKIISVENFGAGDILELEFPSGKTDMFIYDDATFPKLDMENKTIFFHCPETEFVAEDHKKNAEEIEAYQEEVEKQEAEAIKPSQQEK